MTNFLTHYHLSGIAIGLATFFIIGLFHPVVIKCHYYFGTRCWWWFLVLGIIACGASLIIDDIFWSSLVAVVAFSSFWTIKEIFDQEKRVARGWFPANPRRTDKNNKKH